MKNVLFREARSSDAASIHQILTSGIRDDILYLTVYHSNGYISYLQQVLSLPSRWTGMQFLVAEVDERVVGFSEWRLNPEMMFLNNVYVVQGYQGLGIGKKFLEWGLLYTRDENLTALCLDVFDWNTAALSWYTRYGFRVRKTVQWLVGPNPSHEPSQLRVRVPDYPQANAIHDAYGFSTIQVHTRTARHTVGRLGHGYFKMDATAVRDSDLMATLYDLDPHREILVLDSVPCVLGLAQVCTTLRMQLDID